MRRSGFSLIEVLLALAILLMSIVAIAQLVGIGSDRGLETRLTNRGSRLAESKLGEIEVGREPHRAPRAILHDHGVRSETAWRRDL